jgi:hypothetical protein
MLARCRCLRNARQLFARPQALHAAATALAQAPTGLSAASESHRSLGGRSLSTQRELSTYLLSRAKIVQLVARTLLAYPELASLESATSPLGRRFAAGCSMRERMFMFICSLVPPDEPVDIPELLSGSTHAVHAVYQQLYMTGLTGDDVSGVVLSDVATEACVALWKTKLDEQKQALGLPTDSTLTLRGLDVRDARLAEIEYSYSHAHPEQHAESQSVFQLNESLRAKVRFSVTEYVSASTGNDQDEEEEGAEYILDTTFDWSFDSNVSRSSLMDWHIAEATPFVTKLASGVDSDEVQEEESENDSESSQA